VAKKAATEKEEKSDIDKIINKKYGDGVVRKASELLENPPKVIPVSPCIDIALGGGIPEGSWVILTGKQKTGKSTIALTIAANAQKPEYGARKVYYFDVEGRLKPMNLNGIAGLNAKELVVIGSTEDKIMSAQDYLTVAEEILKNEKECVIIIDSYSCLAHEKELTEGIGTSTRGGGAMLLSQFCRQMANVVPVKRHIVIGITHLQANTSGYGAAIQEKGGNSIQYQGDVKLRHKALEYIEDDNGNKIGQKVTWISEFNALGALPQQECLSYITYGTGIDYIRELIELATALDLIELPGAWCYLTFMTGDKDTWAKTNGNAKLNQYLKYNPETKDLLTKKVYELIGKS